MRWGLLLIERIVELLVASIFATGSILLAGVFVGYKRADYIEWLGDHFEISIPLFIVVLLAYLSIFGLLVRYGVFWVRGERKICGLYAQVFFGLHDELIIAPYLVMFDVFKNEIAVVGHAFMVDPASDDLVKHRARWKSEASHINDGHGTMDEIAYIYSGRRSDSMSDIKGVNRSGLVQHATAKPNPMPGYICDLEIPRGSLGLIHDIDGSVTAFRIVSVKFDAPGFGKFVAAVPDRLHRTLVASWRLLCQVPEDTFAHFLCDGGIEFLAGANLTADKSWRRAHDLIKAAAGKCAERRAHLDAAAHPPAAKAHHGAAGR